MTTKTKSAIMWTAIGLGGIGIIYSFAQPNPIKDATTKQRTQVAIFSLATGALFLASGISIGTRGKL